MSSEAIVDSKMAAKSAAAPIRSPGYEAYLKALRWRALSINLWQLGLIAGFLVIWEVAPRAGWINPMLTSYPSAVARTFMAAASDGSRVACPS